MDSDPSQLPCCVSFIFITLELLWSKWAKQFSWVGQLTTPIPTFQGTANHLIKIKLDLRFLILPCFFVEYEVRHLYPRAELQEREARQMWKSGPIPQSLLLTSLKVWLDLSRSLLRFGDKGKIFATHPISHPFQLGDCLVIRLRVPEEW